MTSYFPRAVLTYSGMTAAALATVITVILFKLCTILFSCKHSSADFVLVTLNLCKWRHDSVDESKSAVAKKINKTE